MRRNFRSLLVLFACAVAIDGLASVSIGGIDTSASWSRSGSDNGTLLGRCAAAAGDVNGDGYSDLIMGEEGFSNPLGAEGRALVFYGSPSGPAGSPNWTYEGNQASAKCGYSVAAAGDVNGDGYDDVLVGLPYYDGVGADAGRALLFLGSAGGLGTTPAWTRAGSAAGDLCGFSVGSAGDVNDDGYDDVVIGAPNAPSTSTAGRVYLYLGSETGLSTSAAATIVGETTTSQLGYLVSPAGDVNGDGCDDILAGAPGYVAPGEDTISGKIYLFLGTDSGCNEDPFWELQGGLFDDPQYGTAQAMAGDLNGDGYADVVVGLPFTVTPPDANTDGGRVTVYYGGPAGMTGTAWQVQGDEVGDRVGESVWFAGDLNMDGYADIAFGASGDDQGTTNEGVVYLYLGGPSGPGSTALASLDNDISGSKFGWSVQSAGDVDGDGTSDLIVGAPYADIGPNDAAGAAYLFLGNHTDYLAQSPATVWEGNQATASYGYSVALADVNGDGFADVLVGASQYDNGQTDEGQAYCYLGGPNGPGTSANWRQDSDQADAHFGYVVASAGDVNGDGYEDVVVTAPEYDNPEANEGRAFVYHGSASGLLSNPSWTADGGQVAGYFGLAAASAGDVNGDGYGDLIVGSSLWENGQSDEGAIFLYYGSANGLGIGPTRLEMDRPNVEYGYAVASAGDVNGDGYSDILVGAPSWTTNYAGEGAAFLYIGSSAGLLTAPVWATAGGQQGARYGHALASAGDVNADGFSDVIIGSPYWNGDLIDEGRALVYLGSSEGLAPTTSTIREGNDEAALLGSSVCSAGDVNGDGHSDVAFGAPYYGAGDQGLVRLYIGTTTSIAGGAQWIEAGENGRFGWSIAGAGDANGDGFGDLLVGAKFYNGDLTAEGKTYLYLGGRGDGVTYTPRMAQPSGSVPLALLGRSTNPDGFRIRMVGRSPLGRGRIRAEYELVPSGQAWLGITQFSPEYLTDPPAGGVGSVTPIDLFLSSLHEDRAYHWRMRICPDSPFFPATRWFSPAGNGATETDARTANPQADAAEDLVRPEARIESISPNPMADRVSIRFHLEGAAPSRLTLHDVAGRLVATLGHGDWDAGHHEIVWDGRGRDGRRVGSGIYFVRLASGGRTHQSRISIQP